MKKVFITISVILILIFACNPEDVISEFGDSVVTAKSKIGEVLNTARNNFARDAKLSAVYGINVSTKGRVDLFKPQDNAFIYVVQSDSAKLNEFYVPVYKSYPAKSPINFTTMLSFIEDTQVKAFLGSAFARLSEINISSSASYDDSPQIVEKMLSRSDVINFRLANPGGKIDMILIPSKSIDTTNVSNTADWIVSFYADTTSLVLWLHPGTVNGTVNVISD